MKRPFSILLASVLLIPLVLTACSTSADTAITASGTLSVVEVPVAAEVSGRVVSVSVNEGDSVHAGDELFRLDDEVLQAQYTQGKAAADAASATLTAAQAQLVYAQGQYDLAVQAARAQEGQARVDAWTAAVTPDYQPSWYFQKSEKVVAAQAEVDAAEAALLTEQQTLAREVQNATSQDFIAAEKRLAQAQAAYTTAEATLAQSKRADNKMVTDAAQDGFDLAESELNNARLEYDRMLSTSAADTILRARARVAVAQARYDNARDALSALQTGDNSNQVSVAAAGVEQAQAAVTQAQANLDQATAALALLKLQLDRTVIKAPIDGVLLTRNLEVGELVAAGGITMTIGQLGTMDLTVYIPEDRYGQVTVGQKVEIKVDSFSDEVFFGSVVRIADSAEYTPRNVQSADGRASTVYAVKITVPNTDLRLKPGMPADVTFMP
jgi:HlyD family secretion protein